ncbi:MAG: TldD/PmbA family protein [Candidatus Ranarchaeia archaeon]
MEKQSLAKNDFIDLRFVNKKKTTFSITNGRVNLARIAEDNGVAVRALINGGWGFSFTNSIDEDSLNNTLKDSLAIAEATSKQSDFQGKVVDTPVFSFSNYDEPIGEDIIETSIDEKLGYLLPIEKKVRKSNDNIVSTSIAYGDNVILESVVNSFGTKVNYKNCYAFFSSSVTAKQQGISQSITKSVGNTDGWNELLKNDLPNIAKNTAETAIQQTLAKQSKPRKCPVVLDPVIVGLFVHEAFGHATEADSITSKRSILADKLGEKIASKEVTICEDPTLKPTFGYHLYDSEGTPTRKRNLVDKGIFTEQLHSLETVALMGFDSKMLNGSARAQDHKSLPLVRMSNTYFEPGSWTFDELIEETKDGLYLKAGLFGYTTPIKGELLFSAQESFIIKNGIIEDRIQQTSFSGLTLEILKKIVGISKEWKIEDPGFCGKQGQSVPVDGGGPSMKISEMVVGGR